MACAAALGCRVVSRETRPAGSDGPGLSCGGLARARRRQPAAGPTRGCSGWRPAGRGTAGASVRRRAAYWRRVAAAPFLGREGSGRACARRRFGDRWGPAGPGRGGGTARGGGTPRDRDAWRASARDGDVRGGHRHAASARCGVGTMASGRRGRIGRDSRSGSLAHASVSRETPDQGSVDTAQDERPALLRRSTLGSRGHRPILLRARTVRPPAPTSSRSSVLPSAGRRERRGWVARCFT